MRSLTFSKGKLLGGLACWLFCFALSASAESLNAALLNAYRENPSLQSERARQRGTDELVATAKAGWRPTIIAQGNVSQEWTDTTVTPERDNASATVSIQLTQPIFSGFKTVEATKAAKARVEAGRQQLLAVEQDILLRAVQAYLSVRRDQQILALQKKNLANLRKQAQGVAARFEAGEVTKTDVAQARARASGAEAGVATAKANLEASTASYIAIIGRKPSNLKPAKQAKVPESLEAALKAAHAINPNILAAAQVYDAAQHDVKVARGDLLPSINLRASASTTWQPQDGVERAERAVVEGVLTIPIYQGGAEYARVRQAKQLASQRQIEIIGATRLVRQQVSAAWHVLKSTRENISAAKAQVSAAAQALDGAQQEYAVGSRSTIDVLNAEQELLNARIALVNAETNQVFASYQLLSAIGRLTARHLKLGGPYYDPEDHYDSVKNKWIGTHADTID